MLLAPCAYRRGVLRAALHLLFPIAMVYSNNMVYWFCSKHTWSNDNNHRTHRPCCTRLEWRVL